MSEICELLDRLDPSQLDYNEWLAVGMAVHAEGGTESDWDRWSQRDGKRYKANECRRKWAGFRRDSGGVGAGTVAKMILDRGGRLPKSCRQYERTDREFGWDDPIPEDGVVIDQRFIDDEVVEEPKDWDPAGEIVRYLQALFSNDDHVAYVVASFDQDGRWLPGKASYDRTAGQLIDELSRKKDPGGVFGDWNPDAGAWIKFNPMDGKGYSDRNVIDFRYALVESDKMDVGRQLATIRKLELPVATLVHSGGKSLHATVHIGASSEEEYRKRVGHLYEICRKNGLEVDRQNCNPSRLSRMPGVTRAGRKQFLLDTKIGKPSWDEWKAWHDAESDQLPEVSCMADSWDDLPPLSDPLIDGILRKRHKMGISGPSKAGKSFALISLAAAIVEGRKWLGFQCHQGRVLLVNLEIDPASCLHRIRQVYEAHGWTPDHIQDLDVWNLRGNALPMDRLAPALIRRAMKRRYSAVIVDPIYKVVTGDENSAQEMAKFFNSFDRVCKELNTAVIYCHHHSKGAQGHKSAQDRSSGSGVFARDPDAVLDLVELETTEAIRETLAGRMSCDAAATLLDRDLPQWRDRCPQDDQVVHRRLADWINKEMDQHRARPYLDAMAGAREQALAMTAWRMEATLREFPSFEPRRFWFKWPVHVQDDGMLADALAAGEEPPRGSKRDKEQAIARKKDETIQGTLLAYASCDRDDNGMVTVAAMAEYLGLTEKATKDRIKSAGMEYQRGFVFGKNDETSKTGGSH